MSHEELDPRTRAIVDTLASDKETTGAHSVEMTMLIRNIEKGHKTNATPREKKRAKTANDEFWKSAMKQLKTMATRYVYTHRRFWQYPEDIINEVYKTLAILLTGKKTTQVKDRTHFYSLAANNFRFKLLGLLRKERNHPVGSIDDTNAPDPPGTDTGPGELAERSDDFEKYLERAGEIDKELLDIFDRHTIHGQSIRMIAGELDKPRSTVNDQYQRALHQLQNLLLEPREK